MRNMAYSPKMESLEEERDSYFTRNLASNRSNWERAANDLQSTRIIYQNVNAAYVEVNGNLYIVYKDTGNVREGNFADRINMYTEGTFNSINGLLNTSDISNRAARALDGTPVIGTNWGDSLNDLRNFADSTVGSGTLFDRLGFTKGEQSGSPTSAIGQFLFAPVTIDRGGEFGDDSVRPEFSVNYGLNRLNAGIGSVNEWVNETASRFDAGGNLENYNAIKKLNNFVGGCNEFLENIQKMGKDFDKIIKNSFLGKTFDIKGHEILCAVFCFLISLLPCHVRNQLYLIVKQIKETASMVNSMVDEINRLTEGGQVAFEVPINGQTISQTVGGLFKFEAKNRGKQAELERARDRFISDVIQSAKTDKENTKTVKIPLPVPPELQKTLTLITTILAVLVKGQITIPVGLSGNMFGLMQTVMFMFQMAVVQAADEFLSKYINQLEKLLKAIKIQKCFGNMATKIIKVIMQAVNAIKKWILDQIKQLFGASENFRIYWATFGWEFKNFFELSILLKALALIIKNFADLALLCGVEPCKEGDDPNKPISELELEEAIRSGDISKIGQTNTPAIIVPPKSPNPEPPPDGIDLPPQVNTDPRIPAIAKKVFKLTDPQTVSVDPNGDFSITTPCLFQGAPPGIVRLINSPEFLSELGEAYRICPSQRDTQQGLVDYSFPGIDITYTYKNLCSTR